jgi:hypothetical protein
MDFDEMKNQVMDTFMDNNNEYIIENIINIAVQHCAYPMIDDPGRAYPQMLWINHECNRIYYGEEPAASILFCSACVKLFNLVDNQLALCKEPVLELDSDEILSRLDKIEELIKEIRAMI